MGLAVEIQSGSHMDRTQVGSSTGKERNTAISVSLFPNAALQTDALVRSSGVDLRLSLRLNDPVVDRNAIASSRSGCSRPGGRRVTHCTVCSVA